MKTLSIVMSYYNRQAQLALTLKSIEKSILSDKIEVIIVDDASDEDQRAKPVIKNSKLDIKLMEISKEERVWKNPCIAYNRGFRKASGEIIIIQSAECVHIGDLIYHAANNTTDEKYLTYSCFCTNYEISRQIAENWDINYREVINILNRLRQQHPQLSDWIGWYNHIIYRPTGYHWLSAITAKNLKKLGGFDEQYKDAFAYDDNDFFLRIKIMGLYIEIISEDIGFTVHQQHTRFGDSLQTKGMRSQTNHNLFYKLKAKYEKEYGKKFSPYKKSNALLLG